MLTLTYPADFPMDGLLVKNHWRRFRQWMVRNGGKTGLWVLEFQKRGAPHFHIFLQQLLDRIAVSEAWYRIVNSGDPKHLQAGTRIERFIFPPAIGGYVMKYAAKSAVRIRLAARALPSRGNKGKRQPGSESSHQIVTCCYQRIAVGTSVALFAQRCSG